MAARKPAKSSGPSPWLIFAASLLVGPFISIGSGYIASEINAARIEERLGVLNIRVSDIDTRAVARLDRIEGGLRAGELTSTALATRLEGILREMEGAERRDMERTATIMSAIARLQARLDTARPTGGSDPVNEPWVAPRRAILRRDVTDESDFK